MKIYLQLAVGDEDRYRNRMVFVVAGEIESILFLSLCAGWYFSACVETIELERYLFSPFAGDSRF